MLGGVCGQKREVVSCCRSLKKNKYRLGTNYLMYVPIKVKAESYIHEFNGRVVVQPPIINLGKTAMRITTEGRPYLGSPVGTTEYIVFYFREGP